MFSEQNGTRDQWQKVAGKPQSIRRLNNTLENNKWVKEEMPRHIKNNLNLMKMKMQLIKMCGMQ